ncbi:MAG TPA: ABC transporter permease [Planococcus sp. (in: firmicutes)]|nr:ABC transporter permease [Planococcus sp. (in: firmicutes)]
MKNLHEVWSKRLQKYTIEVQNYMKYIVTGHIAVVMLFAIGAAGYAYSEWVRDIPEGFPGAWLLALVFAVLLAYSPPSTLLKEADMVYFLPLESKLDSYLKPALKWSFLSQIYLPIIAFIVSLPMVNALYGLPSALLVGLPIMLLLLKWWSINTEFSLRKANAGRNAWVDRLIRFGLVLLFVYFYVIGQLLIAILLLFGIIIYGRWAKQQASGKPFPYEHFIALEENRMLRFYQFANLFTDVPHLKGKIKERRWLDWLYSFIKPGPKNAHYYLVWRTFIRSDELFYLWVRLTAISMAGAWLIPFPVAAGIFSAALAFASAIQIWQGLNQTHYFRMDNLFPLSKFSRGQAVRKLVLVVQVLQAILVAATVAMSGQLLFAVIMLAIVLGVSVVTLLSMKNKKR